MSKHGNEMNLGLGVNFSVKAGLQGEIVMFLHVI